MSTPSKILPHIEKAFEIVTLTVKERVMQLFTSEDAPYTIREITDRIGANRKTVAKRVEELLHEGWLKKSPKYGQREGFAYIRAGSGFDADLLKLPFGKDNYRWDELLRHLRSEDSNPPDLIFNEKWWAGIKFNAARLLLSDLIAEDGRFKLSEDERATMKEVLRARAYQVRRVAEILESLASPNYHDSAVRLYFATLIREQSGDATSQNFENTIGDLQRRML